MGADQCPLCTNQRQRGKPYPYEVLLNTADDMDWKSFCDCSILYPLPAAGVRQTPAISGLKCRAYSIFVAAETNGGMSQSRFIAPNWWRIVGKSRSFN